MSNLYYRDTFRAMANDRKFCAGAAIAVLYAFCLVAISNIPENKGLCPSESATRPAACALPGTPKP